MEQPEAIRNTLSPRIRDGKIELGFTRITEEVIRGIDKIYIVACGSASYVGMTSQYMLSKMLHVPVTVELASEFRYSDPVVDANTFVIVISQSGETLDTLFALREAKRRGGRILSIVNVVGSAIANESEDVVYTWAGPEIAVATTKAYSTQLAVMYLIALHFAKVRGHLTDAAQAEAVAALTALPDQVAAMLGKREQMQYLASLFFNLRDIFFIGRNLDYALCLEGSLKLKEISYIHSEAYAAGELKHGTISLIEPGTLVIALCTYAPLREKMVSNIREVKARGAVVIAFTDEADQDGARRGGPCDHPAQMRAAGASLHAADPTAAFRLLCGASEGMRYTRYLRVLQNPSRWNKRGGTRQERAAARGGLGRQPLISICKQRYCAVQVQRRPRAGGASCLCEKARADARA